MTGHIAFSCDDRVGVARLEHVERGNALTEGMLAQLADGLPRLAADGARALVIRGAGKVFCGGYDLGEFPVGTGDAGYAEDDHPASRAFAAIERFEGPTVAALGGHAIGGGVLLALCCDLRFATEGVKLSIPATRLGAVYPERGVRRLVALAGLGRALELLLMAEPVDAATALGWGLVNRVDPRESFDAELDERMRQLALRSPLAVAGVHRVVRRAVLPALDADTRAAMDALTARALASEDLREGIAALQQKRDPEFHGR